MTAFYVILAMVAYFAPSIVAVLLKKANKYSVIVVNFFFGWTIVGWIVALTMAVGANPPTTNVNIINHNENNS